jgi:hypothetical protein
LLLLLLLLLKDILIASFHDSLVTK